MELFHDFVAETLAKHCATGTYRYLVVDTAATRPLNVPRSCGLDGGGIDLLTEEACVWNNSASPVLIVLPSLAPTDVIREKIRRTLALWRYGNCFIYVESSYTPAPFSAMLRERTDAVLPEGLRVLFRYFDPRVFALLRQILHPHQLIAFEAAALLWAFPDRDGTLKFLSSASPDNGGHLNIPIELDEMQEAALINAGEPDAMIDLLMNQGNPNLLAMLPPQQYEHVWNALNKARTTGIQGVTEQAAFCSLSLELGPDFSEETPWVNGLPRVSAGLLKFSQLLEAVSDSAAT